MEREGWVKETLLLNLFEYKRQSIFPHYVFMFIFSV